MFALTFFLLSVFEFIIIINWPLSSYFIGKHLLLTVLILGQRRERYFVISATILPKTTYCRYCPFNERRTWESDSIKWEAKWAIHAWCQLCIIPISCTMRSKVQRFWLFYNMEPPGNRCKMGFWDTFAKSPFFVFLSRFVKF